MKIQTLAVSLGVTWTLFSSLLAWNFSIVSKLQDRQVNPIHYLRSSKQSLTSPRGWLPASIWATRELPGLNRNATKVESLLMINETEKALSLCGRFLFSTLERAIHLKHMGNDAFIATGDIDSMWTRVSVVQMSIYLKHVAHFPWLRLIIDGAIRRNAFNILLDPYANAYEHHWRDPKTLELRDRIIGRGGFVATRNYELDSGAYFLVHLYDYFRTNGIYQADALLREPMVFDAVMTLINTWIVEQHHDDLSPYRYYELPNEGKGTPTGYTGMTWSGFRPSDDACQYGYLIPANIHAAAALQRVLILNDHIWQNDELEAKASKLLKEIKDGINTFGIVVTDNGKRIYAYEVDGLGKELSSFDDANIPSLLSIPLLGWDEYDKEAYDNTRSLLLSKSNSKYFKGSAFTGIGSPHTPFGYVWPMAMVVQGLTEDGPDREEQMAFQMRQLLKSATKDAMHESVYQESPNRFTREWFEWANALFVIYVETLLGTSCAPAASDLHRATQVETLRKETTKDSTSFYKRTRNEPWNPLYYQGVEASIHFESIDQ